MSDIKFSYDINMIPRRLKEVRKLRRLTQEALAEKIESQRQTIIDWENEKNPTIPTIKKLVQICSELDCSIDYLLGSGDIPEADPIAKINHYSNISEDIIKQCIEEPEFLECLNFFMHPDNSKDIFNSLSLLAWKKMYSEYSLNKFNTDLRELLIKYYDEYISLTPIEEINKMTYKEFIEKKFPEKGIKFTSQKTDNGFHLKSYFPYSERKHFYKNQKFDYNLFVLYLVEHTFDALSHRVMIEIQTQKLSKSFAELIIKYITNNTLLL